MSLLLNYILKKGNKMGNSFGCAAAILGFIMLIPVTAVVVYLGTMLIDFLLGTSLLPLLNTAIDSLR